MFFLILLLLSSAKNLVPLLHWTSQDSDLTEKITKTLTKKTRIKSHDGKENLFSFFSDGYCRLGEMRKCSEWMACEMIWEWPPNPRCLIISTNAYIFITSPHPHSLPENLTPRNGVLIMILTQTRINFVKNYLLAFLIFSFLHTF